LACGAALNETTYIRQRSGIYFYNRNSCFSNGFHELGCFIDGTSPVDIFGDCFTPDVLEALRGTENGFIVGECVDSAKCVTCISELIDKGRVAARVATNTRLTLEYIIDVVDCNWISRSRFDTRIVIF